MESRWYLRPGQVLENTKIEDRGHALHVTKDGWAKITKHLDRKRLLQEAIDREEAEKAAKRKECKDMTASWDNSAENLRIRKEEARLARLAKVHEDRMERFFALRRDQAEIKSQFIANARKTLYIAAGAPKAMTSALVEAETMYERDRQLEFNIFLREREKEEERKYAEKVKQGAMDEKREKDEVKRLQCEQKIQVKKIYHKDMQERADAARIAKETSVANERLDNANAQKEMDEIAKITKEEEKRLGSERKKEFLDFLQEQKEAKVRNELEEKEKDAVIQIYSDAKFRINCIRRKKEEEARMAFIKRRDALFKKAMDAAAAVAGVEGAMLQNAADEKEKIEVAQLKAKAEYQEKLIKERKDNFEDYFKREEQRKNIEKEVKKWEMLNRYKNDEILKQYDLDKKIESCEKRKAYRRELDAQVVELNAEKQKNTDEGAMLLKQKLDGYAAEDEKFFRYADEVYEYAKERGWSTYPITQIAKKYSADLNVPFDFKACSHIEQKKSKNKAQVKK